MQDTFTDLSNRLGMLFTALVLAAAATAVWADQPSAQPAGDAEARYEKERAACIAGRSHQDQATCLREAGAARDEARRGQLARANPEYRKNALKRCESLPEADREDCRSRVDGGGAKSGSVEGGGIYRETVTRTVEPAPAK